MRTLVLVLLSSAAALPLAGQAGPVVSPKELTMHVGDAAVLHGYQHPGGLSDGFPYHYDFFSDAPMVAVIRGFASGSSYTHADPLPENGDVFVSALGPGVAHVRTGGFPSALSAITVLPRILPVEIRAEATRVLSGQQIVLTAVVPGYDQAPTFSWYRGRIGDVSHPIRTSSDPRLMFTIADAGISYIWVQALAGSFASSDEIGIEVIQPRRRAVR
jgi:hypothetical protein